MVLSGEGQAKFILYVKKISLPSCIIYNLNISSSMQTNKPGVCVDMSV